MVTKMDIRKIIIQLENENNTIEDFNKTNTKDPAYWKGKKDANIIIKNKLVFLITKN